MVKRKHDYSTRTRANRRGSLSSLNKGRPCYRQSAAVSFCFRLKNTPHIALRQENYEGLTRFLDNHLVPIDNNLSERLLRSPVVGRKTWYGTHSRRAAETAGVHFSIIESCKLIGLNPRDFYADAVRRVHKKDPPVTPQEYKQKRDGNTG